MCCLYDCVDFILCVTGMRVNNNRCVRVSVVLFVFDHLVDSAKVCVNCWCNCLEL